MSVTRNKMQLIVMQKNKRTNYKNLQRCVETSAPDNSSCNTKPSHHTMSVLDFNESHRQTLT